MNAPLQGLLVADFSRVLAGPLAGMLLGDLGATVIKVERPGRGDDSRHWPPYNSDGMSAYFASVNRNKHDLTLDLSEETDRRRAATLAGRADVLIENYRPGTLDARGLGYNTLRTVNPGLVYCSITGFGRFGGADLPGYDLIAQAVGGLMSMTGPADGEPTKVSPPLVDVLTGLHAALGILAALHERRTSGHGQRVEVNLLRSLLVSMVNQSTAYLHTGSVPRRLGNAHPNIAPYAPFPTADGAVVIAVGNDDQFRALAAALDAPELARAAKFATNAARVAHRDDLTRAVTARTCTATTATWAARLSAHAVPHGVINGLDEAFASATALGLHPVAQLPVDDGAATAPATDPPLPSTHVTLAHPVEFSRTGATYHLAPPDLDADGELLRAWLDDPAVTTPPHQALHQLPHKPSPAPSKTVEESHA